MSSNSLREFRYIEATQAYAPSGLPRPLVFLAGGITGCPNWQTEVVSDLKPEPSSNQPPEWPCTILSPRRANFPMDDPTAAEQQVMWEYRALRDADAVVFWFCAETIQPIVLWELSAALERWRLTPPGLRKQEVVIGMSPQYKRAQDVEIQSRLAFGFKRGIERTLDDTIDALRGYLLRTDSFWSAYERGERGRE